MRTEIGKLENKKLTAQINELDCMVIYARILNF